MKNVIWEFLPLILVFVNMIMKARDSMQNFAASLKKAIEHSGVPIAEIATYSGISTAMLYKVQNGTRTLESVAALERILDVIHCSLPLQQELLREYKIARIGTTRYECYQELKTLLAEMSEMARFRPSGEIVVPEKDELIPTAAIGTSNINLMVQQLLYRETARAGGCIRTNLPLRYRFGFESLSQALYHCNKDFVRAVHLFDLKEACSDSANLHNMRAIRSFMPRIVSMKRYEPKYAYLPAAANGMVLFPYFIITSEGVLQLSEDFQSAIFATDPECLNQAVHRFEGISRNCKPCLTSRNVELAPFLLTYRQVEMAMPEGMQVDCIGSRPPILYCIPMERIMKYMPEKLQQDPRIMTVVKEYYDKATGGGVRTLFTLEGLNYLIESGELIDIPGGVLPRIEREDVLTGLEVFLERSRRGIITPHIFRSGLIPADSDCSIALYFNKLYLCCSDAVRETVFTHISETTLATVTGSYLSNAELLGDVFSVEDSISLMERTLRKYGR